MTDPVPPTGPALEIQRRLEAGQDIDRITEAGRWLRAWCREDVLAVAWHRQQQAWAQEAEDDRIAVFEHLRLAPRPAKGTPRAPQHGTRREFSYYGCRCDPCTEANRRYQAEWRRGRRGGAT